MIDEETLHKRLLLRDLIFMQISNERDRQDAIHPEFPREKRLEILVEELGEIGRALYEGDKEHAKEEMIQLAAVTVRWLEHLSREE